MRYLLFVLLSCAVWAPPVAAGRSEDPRLALAQGLGAYLQARERGEDLAPARARVVLALTELAKSRQSGSPLRLNQELGAALARARAHETHKIRKGKITEDTFQAEAFGSQGLRHAYWVPKSYEPQERTYPLLIIVAGVDDDPRDHLQQRWMDRDLCERAILVCPAMPAEVRSWTRVADGGQPGGLTHLLTAARMAGERFAVDPDRVYAMGWAEGVPAVMAAGNYRPHRFAGLVGISGDVAPIPPDNFRNLPILLVAGGARATAFRESMEAAGYGHCTTPASADIADAWHWALERTRTSVPEQVTVLSTSHAREGIDFLQAFPTHIDWLQVAPNAPDCLARASLERSSNTVRIETRGIAEVTLLLNDQMLDLDAALHIWIDGEEREVRVERSLSSTLDMIYRGESDAGRVYVAAKTFTLLPAGDDEDVVLEVAPQPREEPSEELARERGLVRHQDRWVHRDASKLLRKGFRQLETTGVWLDRSQQLQLDKGWQLQDLVWVEPEETARLEEGLWKVGGEWVSLEQANQRRSKIDSLWRIPGPEILLYTTVERRVAARARQAMRSSVTQMRRVFGVEPMLPLKVALLRSEDQYDRLAVGDPEGRWPAAHRGQLHTIHTAFFAEAWFAPLNGQLEHRGMGVGYWDTTIPHGDSYGYHAARLAAGLSYAQAIDPSPKTVAKGPSDSFSKDYEAEKQLPRWLRYGAAVYAERFFPDERVQPDGDRWWARKWSLENLERGGGLRPLEEVFAFELAGRERSDAQKLLIEAGLLVAFLLDGECAAVQEPHAALRRALALQRLERSHVEALCKTIQEHESELFAFARP